MILIDGRYRVACCLKCFNVIDENCVVLFDDFLNRKQYHVVLTYFDVVDKTIDNRMVALRKKRDVIVDNGLIQKYELIQD